MSRIYKVSHNGKTSLIRAHTANTAIRFIADRDIQAEVAGQDDLLGVKKEDVLDATAQAPSDINDPVKQAAE